jgi:hypothetical protein
MKIFASPFLNAVKLSGQEMKKDGETPQSARVLEPKLEVEVPPPDP